MRKIIIVFFALITSCSKPNTSPTIVPPPTTQNQNSNPAKPPDYSTFMPVKNSTAYSSSIDSISISDTMYHPVHTDTLFYVIFGYSIWYDKTNYYNIPTRQNSNVKFYLTVGQFYNPIEITIYQPDGSTLESTEVLKYPGKDSAKFKTTISNRTQIALVHI
jgi:hypothetical protein